MCKIYWTLLLCIGLASCTGSQEARNKEAREDAAKMAEARALQQLVPFELTVDAETTPVQSASGEDAADDPAIWYNSTSPEKSIIIGTNKVAGLYTYDLDGNELHFSACGKVNNVDVRDGFLMGDRSIILVAASNRSSQTISLFELNGETGQLSNSLGEIKTHVDDVYGFTLYEDQGEFFAISNGKNGVIEVFQLQEANNTITGKLTQEFKVESQPEGMTTIDHEDILYVGVEEKHIQAFGLGKSTHSAILPKTASTNNPFIAYDIEGLAQFEYGEKHYLIASIQGSFTYAIFDITTLGEEIYLTSFRLSKNEAGIDGVEETDGLEVLAKPLGANYPEGILVVQDGFNYDGQTLQNQNFKLIDLRKVLEIFPN